IVGVGYRHEGEIGLVGERVTPALLRPHVVNRAFAVFAQERAGTRLDAIAAFLLISFKVGGDELVRCHTQVSGDPGNVVRDDNTQGAAAIGAFRTIVDPENWTTR